MTNPRLVEALIESRTKERTALRYETDTMSVLRQLLDHLGYTDDEIDTFKQLLIALERQGYQLTKRETIP